jgi:hypothetical protein
MAPASTGFVPGKLDSIVLLPDKTPGWTHADKLTLESAKLASELLTINHSFYHTRWNAGFHSRRILLRGTLDGDG